MPICECVFIQCVKNVFAVILSTVCDYIYISELRSDCTTQGPRRLYHICQQQIESGNVLSSYRWANKLSPQYEVDKLHWIAFDCFILRNKQQ